MACKNNLCWSLWKIKPMQTWCIIWIFKGHFVAIFPFLMHPPLCSKITSPCNKKPNPLRNKVYRPFWWPKHVPICENPEWQLFHQWYLVLSFCIINVKVNKELKRHLLFLFNNNSEFFFILSSLMKESKNILKYYWIK